MSSVTMVSTRFSLFWMSRHAALSITHQSWCSLRSVSAMKQISAFEIVLQSFKIFLSSKNRIFCWVWVVHTFNPSSWEAEAGRYLWVLRSPSWSASSRIARATQEPVSWIKKIEKNHKQNFPHMLPRSKWNFYLPLGFRLWRLRCQPNTPRRKESLMEKLTASDDLWVSSWCEGPVWCG